MTGDAMTGEATPPLLRTMRMQRWGRHLLAAWTAWAVACVTLMVILPGEETIPYHLGWAGFALAFGFGSWSRRQLVTALSWYTLATGVALERSWQLGHISWDETTEIPLMFLLALLMVWNVLRRQRALTEVKRLAERDIRVSSDRGRLMQLTSHELRTPLTIARGYLELLQARAHDPEDAQDLVIVADELDRLSRVSDRLIRMIGLRTTRRARPLTSTRSLRSRSSAGGWWRIGTGSWKRRQATPWDLPSGCVPASTRSWRTRSGTRRWATRSVWSDLGDASTSRWLFSTLVPA